VSLFFQKPNGQFLIYEVVLNQQDMERSPSLTEGMARDDVANTLLAG
jgi:hypothetical protein